MTSNFRRILGLALLATAVIVLVGSTTIVDLPGPIVASRPEFVFKFSEVFAGLAVSLTVVGVTLLVWTGKETDKVRSPTLSKHYQSNSARLKRERSEPNRSRGGGI